MASTHRSSRHANRAWGSRIASLGLAALLASAASTAHAQAGNTWVDGRTVPILGELVAVDATGEPGWPYGAEDIEGDGLDSFRPPEQSLDIRTAYAATDASSFWTRVYVSNPNGVGGNIIVYVFIDSDEDAATGGGADATEIHQALTTDPSAGGYDYVIALRGNGSLDAVYEWRQDAFVAVSPLPAEARGEAGSDLDPIDVSTRGYVQAVVPALAVGLTADCRARLFFRSINTSAATTASDINVGEASPCRPVDLDNDGIPDILVPPECGRDAECPGGGVCIDGRCVLATPCITDADCTTEEACADDGRCVARPGGSCASTADCGDLVCLSEQCMPCTTAGAVCGAERTCAPDGRCVTGTPAGAGGSGAGGSTSGGQAGGPLDLLEEGDLVQGGACTCRAVAPAGGRTTAVLPWAILLGAFVALRRRARRC
jgi:hypothetical protein